MGKSCCESKCDEIGQLRNKQAKVLKVVLAINAFMFVVEFGGGIISKSSALLADSMDMLGDATVYAFSLYVLNKSQIWRARASLLKGVIMAAFGVGILFQLIIRILTESVPVAETMGLVGFMALFANLWCLYLLYSRRQDDINMKSTWLCSRNDIIANTGVLGASYLVAVTQSAWPDWIVGSIISFLFISSAYGVIQESLTQTKKLGMESKAAG